MIFTFPLGYLLLFFDCFYLTLMCLTFLIIVDAN